MSKARKEKIKASIYKQVAALENETALQLLEEAASVYGKSGTKDIVNELTPVQQKRLTKSIQQANEGKTVSNNKVKLLTKKWLLK